MLQPLGISAEAEAVYLVLAPIGNATSAELSELSSVLPDELERRLDELRKLGLATEVSRGTWRSLPLPDVANALKARGLAVTSAGDGLRVEVAPVEVGRTAAEHQIVLTDLRTADGGLEELFLSLTSDTQRDALPQTTQGVPA